MPRIGVVAPDTVKIALTEGDWITVKKHLTAGEKAKLGGAGLEALRQYGNDTNHRAVELNFERLGLARIEAYVTAWSFLNLDESPLKVTPETISALMPEIAKEIDDALDKHVEGMEKAKNVGAPATESVTT